MGDREDLGKINYELRKMHGEEASSEGNRKMMRLLGDQRTLVEKVRGNDNSSKYRNEVEPAIKEYIKTPERRRHLWSD